MTNPPEPSRKPSVPSDSGEVGEPGAETPVLAQLMAGRGMHGDVEEDPNLANHVLWLNVVLPLVISGLLYLMLR